LQLLFGQHLDIAFSLHPNPILVLNVFIRLSPLQALGQLPLHSSPKASKVKAIKFSEVAMDYTTKTTLAVDCTIEIVVTMDYTINTINGKNYYKKRDKTLG
jgi:hypothetical protein